MYVTEITEGRVSVRSPNGVTRVVHGDMPVANPITFHKGRLLAGECRVGGRIMELELDGGAPRVIRDHVPMPNAYEAGPDGKPSIRSAHRRLGKECVSTGRYRW